MRWIVTFGLASAAVLFLTRAAWLPFLYTFLDVSQPPERSDFIIILGGRLNRAETAIELFRQGYAPRLLVSGDVPMVADYLEVLDRASIPRSAVLTNDQATSTWDEAQQAFELLEREGAQSAIIVTDAVHTRRAKATYRALMPDPPLRLTFVAAVEDFTRDNWWLDKEGVKFVSEEYSKLVYYLVQYGVWFW